MRAFFFWFAHQLLDLFGIILLRTSLEEKRKGFGGFILLGIKSSDWLVDTMEEALESQRKEDFARSFHDEVRVLKVQMGSNRAGCFIEVVVFVEGSRKGVIKLPEGCGCWGWQRFVDELRLMIAQLVAKVLPAVVNAGVDGSPPSYAKVLATPSGGLKSSCVEALASDLGRWLLMGGGACLMEALWSLAMEFLAKMRAKMDWVIFCRLGLNIKASRDIRKRMVRVFS
jgi:hypothetical protein